MKIRIFYVDITVVIRKKKEYGPQSIPLRGKSKENQRKKRIKKGTVK